MRNIRHLKSATASEVKLIFQAENKETAIQLAKSPFKKYGDKAENAMDRLKCGLEDSLAVLDLPVRYRKVLRTTNLAQRMNNDGSIKKVSQDF